MLIGWTVLLSNSVDSLVKIAQLQGAKASKSSQHRFLQGGDGQLVPVPSPAAGSMIGHVVRLLVRDELDSTGLHWGFYLCAGLFISFSLSVLAVAADGRALRPLVGSAV